MMKNFNKTLIALAVTAASTQALAAGFQLNSQSATGVGRAFAGDAIIADNASVLSRNPAAMAMFDKAAFSGGLTVADVEVNVDNGIWAHNSLNPQTGAPVTQVLAYEDYGDGAETKLIPNIYYIHPINKTYAIGVGAFSNFGTGTDLFDLAPANTPSRQAICGSTTNVNTISPDCYPFDVIGKTEVTTINFNVSVSARLNDHWSVGAGLDAVYGEGILEREGIFNPLGGNGFSGRSTAVDVDANGWGIGGILGVAYEYNADHRIGLSYRVSPEIDVEGTVNAFSTDSLGLVPFDKLTVPLADIAQLAGFHQITPKFALSYTAQWSKWSDFSSIDLTGYGMTTPLKEYNWKNSWFLSVAGTYTINDQWLVRVGIADDTTVIDQVQSLSIPDSDRMWYTLGATYHLNQQHSIDFGYARVEGDTINVTELSGVADLSALSLSSAFPTNGAFNADTTSSANYISVQYNYNF